MQRKPNIKWRESDIINLEKQIRNFNAKIRRVKKNHPELAEYQPKPISKKEFMKNITTETVTPTGEIIGTHITRQDFNREMNSLKRYSSIKGSEQPVKAKNTGNIVTKWEKKEVSLMVAQVNRNRARERKEMNVDRPDMQTGTRKQVELEPKKFDFDNVRSGKEWDKLKLTLHKQTQANYQTEKSDNYKRVYLETIQLNLGQSGDELYNFISKVPSEVLRLAYWSDDEVLKIQFTSDPLNADEINDVTLEHWRERLGLEDGEDYEDITQD